MKQMREKRLRASLFGLAKGRNLTSDDYYEVRHLDDLSVAVLCDGVGSASRGQEASRRVAGSLIQNFKNRPSSWDIPKALTLFIESINRVLYQESMEQYGREELVTTLAVAVIKGDRLYGANVGDSRIYLQRNGHLEQLSVDQVVEGTDHILLQAIGLSPDVSPYYFENILQPGDSLLLCSDGLYTLIESDELVSGMKIGAHHLVKQASRKTNDNLPDDTSAVTIEILETDRIRQMRETALIIPEKLKSGDTIDGYILIKPLVQNERTWLAEKGGVKLVLKFAPVGAIDDEKLLDLFVNEAWNAKRIKAGFFAKAWIDNKRTHRFYIMEYIDGTDLKSYLKKRRLSIDESVALAAFLLHASAYLLKFDLVHGDIKPENIILTKREGKTVFKLVDFGSIVEMFSITSRAGTPSYLSPERFEGGAISERSEIFAIGVTLYEALTGHFPYGEIEPFQSPHFKVPVKPTVYNKKIPGWLEHIILHAIERDPERRYRNYSEMEFELSQPGKVKPHFEKHVSLLERNPAETYKWLFLIMLLVNIILWVYCPR